MVSFQSSASVGGVGFAGSGARYISNDFCSSSEDGVRPITTKHDTAYTSRFAREANFSSAKEVNSRNVKIVTYDEILEQLKLLRKFLLPEDSER